MSRPKSKMTTDERRREFAVSGLGMNWALAKTLDFQTAQLTMIFGLMTAKIPKTINNRAIMSFGDILNN